MKKAGNRNKEVLGEGQGQKIHRTVKGGEREGAGSQRRLSSF